ncbi:MAG: universal stress protein [Balneolaceae bacterium]
MIKRILVALDPDKDTPIATKFAIRLAKRFNATLTGLAVVDIRNISARIGSGGWGAGLYTNRIWEELSDESRETASKLLDAFEKSVKNEGVNYTSIKKHGASNETIIEETKYHDLLIVGRDSHFFYDEPQKKTDTLAEVVKGGVAPALVVTDTYSEVERILIAVDGSAPAARSFKSFVHLLPYGKDLDIELVHIREGDSEGEKNKSDYVLGMAEKYLKDHNFNYVTARSLEPGNPSERLMTRREEFNPDIIVLGAHSVSAIKRITFGSTTHEMITKSPTPLFLSP